MNRITPEQVQEAYEKTGLRPLSRAWADRTEEGNKCACAITAIVYSKVYEEQLFEDVLYSLEEGGYDAVVHLMDNGITSEYVWGFIYGFDNLPSSPPLFILQKGEYNLGYEDGEKVRLAIFGTTTTTQGQEEIE